MFVDSLEVEDNLRMSKKLSDQDSGDKSRTNKIYKEMLKNGLGIYNLDPSRHGNNLMMYFWISGVRGY